MGSNIELTKYRESPRLVSIQPRKDTKEKCFDPIGNTKLDWEYIRRSIMDRNNNLNQECSIDGLAKKHGMLILVVCTLFGVFNLVGGKVLVGVLTMVASSIVFIVCKAISNQPTNKQGMHLTLMTTLVIAGLGAIDGVMHAIYPLLVANMAIGGLYNDNKNHIRTWILSDILIMLGFIAPSKLYAGANINVIAISLLGLNVGAVMMRILIQEQVKRIEAVKEKASEIESLLAEVNNQVEYGNILTEKQSNMINNVADIAVRLDGSSNEMQSMATHLNSAANEQAASINGIQLSINLFAENTSKCLEVSTKATESAVNSANVLNDNATNMENMQKAMREIEETSGRIGGIIKTIEDIAFQTNILALNAAVEAARAGSAGKGFSVVADEVRSLAAKSAEAAKNSTELINESIEAVKHGTSYANAAAKQVESVISSSQESEAYSREILRLIEEQKVSMDEIRSRIQEVSGVVNDTSAMAAQSAEIATTLADEVSRMNQIVSNR